MAKVSWKLSEDHRAIFDSETGIWRELDPALPLFLKLACQGCPNLPKCVGMERSDREFFCQVWATKEIPMDG